MNMRSVKFLVLVSLIIIFGFASRSVVLGAELSQVTNPSPSPPAGVSRDPKTPIKLGNPAPVVNLKETPIPPEVGQPISPSQPTKTIEEKPAAAGEFPPAVKMENLPEPPEPVVPDAQRLEPVSAPMRPASQDTVERAEEKAEEEGIYFNVAEQDILSVIKQISRATGKNFIIGSDVKGGKITIISERKMTKDEIWETFLSALEVAGYTIVQGPAGMIKIVKLQGVLKYPLPIETEETPYTDQYITRLVPLKNISALDMSNAIKDMVSPTGNLFAYPTTNTLIITDTGANIERLLKLVKELDRAGPDEILEIIPIRYATASDIAGKIQEIYPTDDVASAARGGAPTRKARRGAAAQGIEVEELPSVQKILSDERTNSLIILASKMAVSKIRGLIAKLDTPLGEGQEGRVHVYYLKHASAEELASTLQSLVSATSTASKDKKAAAQKAGPEAFVLGDFESEVKITADKNTNALVIIATQRDYKMLIEKVVSKLDIPRSQVYVEAVIMELTTESGVGIGTGGLGGYAFKGGDIAAFGSTLGFLNSGNPLDPFTPLLGGGAGAANTNTTIPVVLPTTGDNTQTVNVPSFFAAFLAQARDVEANILSTPNLLTLDNQKATIEVGKTIPYRGPTTVTSTGNPVTSYETKDITLKLEITPQINESRTIQLEVVQKVEDILPAGQQAAIGQITSEAGPATSKREVSTTVVANDAQTIVIGGLMEDKDRITINKIPILGDIPILGYFFKTKAKTRVKSNLLIFLTPHVIREPKDFLAILQQKINERNTFIKENYGRSQQKYIKKTISRHAERLLEFQEDLLVPSTGAEERKSDSTASDKNSPYWEDTGAATGEEREPESKPEQQSIPEPSQQPSLESEEPPSAEEPVQPPGPSEPSPPLLEGEDVDLAL